jgi:hypothetical protein
MKKLTLAVLCLSTATLCADIDLGALAYATVGNQPTASASNTTVSAYDIYLANQQQAAYDHYIWQQQMNAMSRRINSDIEAIRKMSNAK